MRVNTHGSAALADVFLLVFNLREQVHQPAGVLLEVGRLAICVCFKDGAWQCGDLARDAAKRRRPLESDGHAAGQQYTSFAAGYASAGCSAVWEQRRHTGKCKPLDRPLLECHDKHRSRVGGVRTAER